MMVILNRLSFTKTWSSVCWIAFFKREIYFLISHIRSHCLEHFKTLFRVRMVFSQTRDVKFLVFQRFLLNDYCHLHHWQIAVPVAIVLYLIIGSTRLVIHLYLSVVNWESVTKFEISWWTSSTSSANIRQTFSGHIWRQKPISNKNNAFFKKKKVSKKQLRPQIESNAASKIELRIVKISTI